VAEEYGCKHGELRMVSRARGCKSSPFGGLRGLRPHRICAQRETELIRVGERHKPPAKEVFSSSGDSIDIGLITSGCDLCVPQSSDARDDVR
jgi:hypothetical protein